MLKKLLMFCLAFALSMGVAWAAVDVNTADQPALESVKGLGPVKSKAIIDERTTHGPFKSADDLADRVKGLGTKSVAKLEDAGLTIGGSSAPPTGKKSADRTVGSARTAAAGTASTIKSTPAATGATSPAATTQTTPAATASSSAKPATAAAASISAVPGSGAKASKKVSQKPRKKKGNAASDAAASQ